MSARRLCLSFLVPALVSVGSAACGNRAIDSRIEALGPEAPGIAPSEFHRPGQPCVLCHSDYEGAEPEISVGGTIFGTPSKDGSLPVVVEKAVVTLVDSEGEVRTATTNCAGNFFLTKEQWNPSFPLKVEVNYPDPADPTRIRPALPMQSRISRDGSCAGCHHGQRTQASPGFVFCEEAPKVPFTVPACPEAKQ